MRYLLAALIAAHGVAHFVGFAGPWKLMDPVRVTYSHGLLNGSIQVSDRTLRALGLVWLVLALGFLVAGGAVALTRPWWSPLAIMLISVSLTMCFLQWPAARIGVFVNAVLLGAVLLVDGRSSL